MAKQRGLGKGLEALFADNNTVDAQGTVTLKLTEIEPNREQPRKRFDEEALAQLAESIREHGILQPLLVKPQTNGTYLLVAGERRWRAARMAGLAEVPVIVKELSDQEAMEIALIENLQREDLNPVEEALGYKAGWEIPFCCSKRHAVNRAAKGGIASCRKRFTFRRTRACNPFAGR